MSKDGDILPKVKNQIVNNHWVLLIWRFGMTNLLSLEDLVGFCSKPGIYCIRVNRPSVQQNVLVLFWGTIKIIWIVPHLRSSFPVWISSTKMAFLYSWMSSINLKQSHRVTFGVIPKVPNSNIIAACDIIEALPVYWIMTSLWQAFILQQAILNLINVYISGRTI